MGQHLGKAAHQPDTVQDFAYAGDLDGRQAVREARLQGMREGFDSGYQSVKEQVLQQARAQAEKEQAALETECASLQEETRRQLAAKQDALPALAMQKARRMLEQVLHQSDEAFLHLFLRAAAHVNTTESAVLRVNSYGGAVAARHMDWMKRQIDGLQELEIRPVEGDDGLCILETAAGSVDASVKTQFQKAMQLAGFAEKNGEGGCRNAQTGNRQNPSG